MKISVFGLGYVGAVSCACLPELGHSVIGVDTNPLKVRMINEGQSPVVEEGINELIGAARQAGQLQATQDVEFAILHTDVTLISVATPSQANYEPDLSAVDAVIRQIGTVLAKKEGPHTIVLRSTVQPGTTEDRIQPILEGAAGQAEEARGLGRAEVAWWQAGVRVGHREPPVMLSDAAHRARRSHRRLAKRDRGGGVRRLRSGKRPPRSEANAGTGCQQFPVSAVTDRAGGGEEA